jgi:hypothetical protein
VALTANALPHITPVRYYVVGETIFLDTSTFDVGDNIVGNVIALECGIDDIAGSGTLWSVCAVGVPVPSNDIPVTEPILRLHPELIRGWMQSALAPHTGQ